MTHTIFSYLPWAIGLAYLLVCEIVDTQDRLKKLEKASPRTWKLVNNRLLRIALLIVCLGFLGKDIANDIPPIPTPPPVVIKAPPPPIQLPPKIVYLPQKPTPSPPTPPKLVSDFAELQFGFYPGPNDSFPKITDDILMRDGTVTVDFTVRGGPSKAAIDGSFWIIICGGCKFAKEPDGFTSVAGQDEHQRFMNFQRVFANVFLPKMTAVITPPAGQTRFQIAFKYACENCAPSPPVQTLTVHAIP